MSTIDKAVEVIRREFEDDSKVYDEYSVSSALYNDGLLTPTPQIIRTPAGLEALDPDTALLDDGTVVFVEEVVGNKYWKVVFPAVVVATGAHVRACREALEGETT